MVEWKLPNGALNEALIARREALYTGMNGQTVERLFLAAGGSAIYKPLTNDSQFGREIWVYEHVLPAFPPIYPRLLAFSAGNSDDAERQRSSWCLFEDLGPLTHAFRLDTAEALIPHIAEWHGLPVDGLETAPLLGPKPMIEQLVQDVIAREAELHALLTALPGGSGKANGLEATAGAGLSEGTGSTSGSVLRDATRMNGGCGSSGATGLLHMVLGPLRDCDAIADSASPEHSETIGWRRRVLSHGDLHLGNYALAGGEIKVLDWEHVHLNAPYWDLYHLLDLSHPVFPRTMDAPTRQRLLDDYLRAAARKGNIWEPAAFKRGYARFAAVFSLWMLLLIEQDLAAIAKNDGLPAKWSPEQLGRQRQETLASFGQCAEMLR